MIRSTLVLTGCALGGALVLSVPAALADPGSGQPDLGYGVAGSVALTAAVGDLQGTRLAHQGTATIAASSRWTYDPVSGNSDAVLQVQRLDAAGRPDPGFGDGGTQLVRFPPGPAAVRGLVVQPDGAVVVLASTGGGAYEDQQVGLVRLSLDGRPDASFGVGGTVVTDLRAQHLSPVALLALPDGGVLVGLDQDGRGTSDFALARYGRHGRLVPTYGRAGVATLDLGADDHLTALADAGHGAVTAVGDSATADSQDVAVARLTSTGRPDPGFGTRGRVRFRAGGAYAVGRAVTRTGAGVLVSGTASDDSGGAGFLARLDGRGRLVGRFGTHGVLTVDTPGRPDAPGRPVVMSDGTVVFSRLVGDGPFDGQLQRVTADTGAPVPGFGTDGTVDLGESVVDDVLADGTGLLASVTVFDADGPHEVVQRRS